MNHWKRWLAISAAGIIGIAVILLAICFAGVDYLVNTWWFDSLGYGFYYWQRLLYRYVIFGAVTLVFFLIFFLNFWVASRYLGNAQPAPSRSKGKSTALAPYTKLIRMFRTGSMWLYTPISLVLSIVIALPIFEKWESFLLFLMGPQAGIRDSIYGKDVSFYLFSFPIFTLIQNRLLLAFLILLAGLLVLYLIERRVLSRQEQHIPAGAKWHLCVLVLLTFFIEIGDYLLQRYGLVYSDVHMPLFYGGGFIEMRILLPLIWLTLLFLMGTAFSTIYYIQTRKGLPVLIVFIAGFAVFLGIRYSTFFPETVEKYIVKPNEVSRERPFIENNIKATLNAYNLNNVETRDFTPARIPGDIAAPKIRAELRNIPVWDGDLLDDVFKQLQQLRTYYTFPTVDVARYTVNGMYQQVFLSTRELDYTLIPEAARNWVNEHLSYTHGYGAVMTPAGQGGDEPMTWFLRGIPPESEYGFSIKQPAIYLGLGSYTYVIAPNDAGQIDYPKGNANVMVNYQGQDGVRMSSLFRKLIFAYYFGDRNIFFTTKTNSESKILFRRNIIERIRTLTPYLLLDRDPYAVVTPGKIFWIQDAYTTSDWYPGATPHEWNGEKLNYIRNSVKIVVDAFDGKVDFYIFDPKDPIVRAYSRMYPGLFKSADQMPAELKAQVRYPRDIFEMQMSIYAKYQQTDPEVYYQQEDMWEFAKTFQDKTMIDINPYYVTLDLIDPNRFDFLLLAPMSPKGRDNLRALALAGSDPPYYGKIIVYNFPKGELIYGPSQIYALINQDTKVSEQFTLWDQSGSQVARGKMIILPISNVILYIQPVYLKSSTKLKIPELKRLIMSQGQIVVMEPSLEDAYTRLQERIKSETEKVDKRFAPLLQGAPSGVEGVPAPGQP